MEAGWKVLGQALAEEESRLGVGSNGDEQYSVLLLQGCWYLHGAAANPARIRTVYEAALKLLPGCGMLWEGVILLEQLIGGEDVG